MTHASAAALDYAATTAANDNAPVIIDLFAGGGGASEAILAAIGRHPDVAVNHDREAIGMHEVNHPSTRHYCDDIRKVDPEEVMSHYPGRTVGLMWASPDCKDHSKAKGGKPKDANIRGLAWEVCRWAAGVRRATGQLPAVIALENVEEFADWGPVHKYGRRAGTVMRGRRKETFNLWVENLRSMGYHDIQWKELVAADYGAPTTRKRLFLIARSDGLPIEWPKPTHGKPPKVEGLFAGQAIPMPGGLQPWRAAYEIIDWSQEIPSIFGREAQGKQDLKPKTMARIAKGTRRHVITAAKPFIVPVTHTSNGAINHSSDDPLRTLTTAKGGEFAIVAPSFMPLTHAGQLDRSYSASSPIATITGANRGELGIFAPTMVMAGSSVGVGGRAGQSPERPLTMPFNTFTAKADRAIAMAFMVPRYGERPGQEPRSRSIETSAATVVPTGNGDTLTSVFMIRTDMHQSNAGCFYTAEDPLRTATTSGGFAVAEVVMAPWVAQNNGGRVGRDATDPITTLTHRGTQQTVAGVFMSKMSENGIGYMPSSPLHTAMAGAPRHYQVAAFMNRSFGTTVSGRDLQDPHPAVMTDGAGGKSSVVTTDLAFVGQQYGRSVGMDFTLPTGTIMGKGKAQVIAARAAPFIDKYYGTGVPQSADRPLGSSTTKDRFGMSAVYVEQANTGMVGRKATDPISTIVGKGCTQRIVNARLEKMGAPVGSRRRDVLAFLWEHFGVPTEAEWENPLDTEDGRVKFGLVVIEGVVWQIVDIGMRMLIPRELYRAQGFRESYVIDRTSEIDPKTGEFKKITKTGQTRMAGNSVSPPPATALLQSNLPRGLEMRMAA